MKEIHLFCFNLQYVFWKKHSFKQYVLFIYWVQKTDYNQLSWRMNIFISSDQFFWNIIIDLGISALLLFTWIGSIKVICHSAIYSVQGTGRHWWTYSRLWGQTSCNAGYRFVPVFLIFRSLFKVPLSRFTSLFYSLVCFIYLNRFTLLFVS